MIYIEQSEKLLKAFEKLMRSSHRDLLRRQVESKFGDGNEMVDKYGKEKFAILDQDKIKVELSMDFSCLRTIKEQTVLASIISKAMSDCRTKSVKANIQSCYVAPSKIENIYKHLKLKTNQDSAMQACTDVEIDGKKFTWRDAELKGFELSISMTRELNGFDLKKIESQKNKLFSQLKKNLGYNLDNALRNLQKNEVTRDKEVSENLSIGSP